MNFRRAMLIAMGPSVRGSRALDNGEQ
jgi:hypothetical protein